jgi:hypothetical protein
MRLGCVLMSNPVMLLQLVLLSLLLPLLLLLLQLL